MKRTVRIFTTVAAIALTLAIMCVGIFAATKITLSSGGSTISFTATNDVSATVTATKKMGSDEAVNLLEGKGEYLPSTNQGQEHTETIALGDIKFTQIGETFTLTFTVTNTFVNESIVSAKYSVTCANADGYLVIDNKAGDEAFTSGDSVDIAKDAPVTFTTTISINQEKVDEVLQSGISEAFGFSLELTKKAA